MTWAKFGTEFRGQVISARLSDAAARTHALGAHEGGRSEVSLPDESGIPDEGETDAADHIAYELSELTDTTGTELAALTRAVERLGDILDKRLA